MHKMTFYTVGDLPKTFQPIADKWIKQLSSYIQMDHRVIKDAEKLLDKWPQGFVVVLDAAGTQLTSEALATRLNELMSFGQHATIILGGAKGLSDEIKNRADFTLSLSPMTTTHDLAHLFFLEQLYRATTIIHGREYHY
jgi:23S rRNA (pseudouridine1915-N3)-methyltransferase